MADGFVIELGTTQGTPARVTREHHGVKQAIQVAVRDLGQVLVDLPELPATATRAEWVDLLATPASVAVHRSREKRTNLVWTYPTRTIQVTAGLNGQEQSYQTVRVVIPPTTWVGCFADDRLTEAFLFISQAKPLSLDSVQVLFPWPWGNVDRVNGRVCWGTANPTTVQLSDAYLADRLFFGTKLNEHLWGDMGARPITGHPGGKTPGEWFQEWATQHPEEPMDPRWETMRTGWTTLWQAVSR